MRIFHLMKRIDHKAFTPGQEGAYRSWMAMRNRCKFHRLYAGKVRICDRWIDFYAFLEDMGERPEGMSLDRFPNNKGDYEPGNCRWATQKEQIANSEQRRDVEQLTKEEAAEIKRRFDAGEHYADLAEEFDCSQMTIHRVARGETFAGPPQLEGADMSDALAAINSMRRRATK